MRSVERGTEGDVSTYRAVFASDSAHRHQWQPGTEIQIDVQPKAGADLQEYHFAFAAEGVKQEWYDYLKVWEGYRNNWYDYLKVWEDSVEFRRVA